MTNNICENITEKESRYLEQKLEEYTERFVESRNTEDLGLVLRDNNGTVLGGITGNTVWDWLQISVLWVSDELRGEGLGHQLLERAEEIGRRRGCKHARLSTFEFEAREFYVSHGYIVYAQTEEFPPEHTQFHLRKAL